MIREARRGRPFCGRTCSLTNKTTRRVWFGRYAQEPIQVLPVDAPDRHDLAHLRGSRALPGRCFGLQDRCTNAPLLLCRRHPPAPRPRARAHTRARPRYICRKTDRWACYHYRANTTSGRRERATLFPSSRRPMGHAGNGEYNTTSFTSGAGGGKIKTGLNKPKKKRPNE